MESVQHHQSVEIKVVLGEKYGVVLAHQSDSLHSIKERAGVALEMEPGVIDAYLFEFNGKEISDESLSLLEELAGQFSHKVELHLKKKPHLITYFVNGEAQTTSHHELSVRQILEGAGFKPAEEYTLRSVNPPKDFGSNYDECVKVHQNERFDAFFKGVTPTS